jgi:hypothetical protein
VFRNPTGEQYAPTIELSYTGWATTTASIAAPSESEVVDYP